MIIAIYRQYARIYQLLQNSEGTQFEKLRDGFTFSAYKWAVQIIQTRQNGYPGLNRMELNDLLLIPIVDLCNHHSKPSARISRTGSDNEKGKNFRPKKHCNKNIFRQTFFRQKNRHFTPRKTFSARKHFWPKNIFRKKTFSAKKYFSPKKHFPKKKTYSPKHHFPPKNIFPKFFRQKRFYVKKRFSAENVTHFLL